MGVKPVYDENRYRVKLLLRRIKGDSDELPDYANIDTGVHHHDHVPYN